MRRSYNITLVLLDILTVSVAWAVARPASITGLTPPLVASSTEPGDDPPGSDPDELEPDPDL